MQHVIARSPIEVLRGCMLGVAVGDALGEPVEFLKENEIRRIYGPDGITDYPGSVGWITDDTQMTIATAKGLLDSVMAVQAGDVAAVAANIYQQYLLWHASQSDPAERRGPGRTCMSALGSGRMGSVADPINDSKGCGGVMRVAPVGLALPGRPQLAYRLGEASAAITHGHPGGYTPAGFLAALISELAAGVVLDDAVRDLTAVTPLDATTRRLIEAACRLANAKVGPAEAFTELGEGWTGDEALAIALYAALRCDSDFTAALFLAVNHSGDSDSTGSICGAILGAACGAPAIPERLLVNLERRDEIEGLSREMARAFA